MFEILIILFILFIITIRFFKSKIKGLIGEKTVSAILYFLNKSEYKVLNNVVLKTEYSTSQIDHVVISDYGIFVIETKNFKGWILGGENSAYWTQVIYKYKKKFYNPVWQNKGHIKALKSCLKEFPNLKYKSIVVFSTQAEIKVDTLAEVVNSNRLIKTIKKYNQVNLTTNDKELILEKINSCNISASYNRRDHIKAIKKRIFTWENKIKDGKCPKCGHELVERKGDFGKFFGCKSYPRCNFKETL